MRTPGLNGDGGGGSNIIEKHREWRVFRESTAELTWWTVVMELSTTAATRGGDAETSDRRYRRRWPEGQLPWVSWFHWELDGCRRSPDPKQ